MPRIILLRHAKAAQHSAGTDHARPLVERGREDVALIGRWMREQGLSPDLALVSDSRRTRETMELLLPHLARAPHLRIDPGLYLAEAPRLARALKAAPPSTASLLLVGHNPGLHELALGLVGAGEPAAVAALAANLPTAAVAVVDFEGAWSDLAELSGRLTRYVTAKSLRDRD